MRIIHNREEMLTMPLVFFFILVGRKAKYEGSPKGTVPMGNMNLFVNRRLYLWGYPESGCVITYIQVSRYLRTCRRRRDRPASAIP